MTEVTIVQQINEVAVTKRDFALDVTAPGPQGPSGLDGERGPAGAAGGSVFLFAQEVASSTWVINHNVGRAVAVVLFDDDGNVVQSDIEHGTSNQATVTWSSPTTGTALVI